MTNNKWIQSLQKWNKEKGNPCYRVPKKGTAEYNEVKAIMNSMSGKGKQKGGWKTFIPTPAGIPKDVWKKTLEMKGSGFMGVPNIMDMYQKMPFGKMVKPLFSYVNN